METFVRCKRQRGLSLISLLMLFLLGGFFVTCVLKMGPVYIEAWNFRTILTDLEGQFANAEVVDKFEIRKKIQRRMDIDMIDAIQPDQIKVRRDGDVYVVSGDYEVRVALIGNVDVVMKFANQVNIPLPNQ